MVKIVSKAPKEYLKQGLNLCGACSVKAILSAYGKDDKEKAQDYLPGILKYVRPPTGKILIDVLKSYGFNASLESAKHLSDQERLSLLKELIDKDTPVMLRIGNGYLPNGKHSKLIAAFIGHWITLWGYNDDEGVFYVYDPYLSIKRYDKTIPIGNVKRTFDEVLRDMGYGFPFARRYNYIRLDAE